MLTVSLTLAILCSASALTGPALAGTVESLQQGSTPQLRSVARFPYESGTDVAFSGNYAYAAQSGSAGGVHIFDVSGGVPRQIAFASCPGFENDVVVVRPGLIALAYHSGICGDIQGGGVRLIDVSEPRRPTHLGAIGFPGGAHTLSVYPGQDLLYVSPGGLTGDPPDEYIVDVSDPSRPKLRSTFRPNEAGCHDVSFHFRGRRRLGFCSGPTETQIWNVSRPLRPQIVSRIINPLIQTANSAVASPDGDLLLISDEAELGHTCGTGGPLGGLWAYDISKEESPAVIGHVGPGKGESTIGTFCSAHNFNFLARSRIVVGAWYTGGTRVLDFTDPAKPREVARYLGQRSFAWSSYWHRGLVYVSDLRRGLEIFDAGHLDESQADPPSASAVSLRPIGLMAMESAGGPLLGGEPTYISNVQLKGS